MSASKRKHDWATLQTFLNAHDRVLRTFAKFMTSPKEYREEWVTENYLRLECVGIEFTTYNGNQVRVDITKDVAVDDTNPRRRLALTDGYSYNANRSRGGNLVRYNSPDPPASRTSSTPAHHYHHHKHDWSTGREVITYLGDDEWPHVDEFFREVLEKF